MLNECTNYIQLIIGIIGLVFNLGLFVAVYLTLKNLNAKDKITVTDVKVGVLFSLLLVFMLSLPIVTFMMGGIKTDIECMKYKTELKCGKYNDNK